MMPVRRPSNRGGNIIGSFPSLKLGHPVPYESTIERDLIFFLEFARTVARYEAQPVTIETMLEDGKRHRYTPDFLVVLTASAGSVLVECKPAAKLEDAAVRRQLTIGQGWADTHGCRYMVVSDEDLRAGALLRNLKLLWRYRRYTVPDAAVARCLALLRAYPGVTFGDVAAQLAGSAAPLSTAPVLYHLLFLQVLQAELAVPLGPASSLWLPGQRDDIRFVLFPSVAAP
jgi:hypothetical protein